MSKELAKNYDFKGLEERIYKNWLDKNYFHAEVDKTKQPYTIVIPPPNVTGQLHMGHALNSTIQDILIRFKRMQGFNTLWVPGTDHASISTELKVVEKMKLEGFTKDDVGRDGFLERAWEWKETYGSRIIEQLKKLGCSCDWERERFTMDDGLSKAVTEVFIRLHEKGYIYRGEKLVNWCPSCMTTISDAEVEHEEKSGKFWHLKYKIDGTQEFLIFATTRPETMLGDTAIAVHPDDERYTKYVGKTVTLPIVGRTIPIIADRYVDMEKGTGVVKITPAHDPNDFEVGNRHNLERINIMNDDGSINENGGKFQGLDRYEARAKIIEEFKELGLFVKTEDINHAVGTHERCHAVVEPLLKLQWFVKMEDMAKPALEVYEKNELNFVPDRFGKVYSHWLHNIKDWCISRQLWWGHRIPAYYCDECEHIEIAKEKPSKCSKCSCENLTQDEDSLDTWFSSALWPFSTLGWPDNTEELEHFYPTNVLVTAYDIIFFWVVRMVFSGLEQMDELPFKDVFIHGLIRDAEGRKMSKSLGNGIDPLEIIGEYGTDALRLTLVTGNSPGNDMRFQMDKLESNRNFMNKLWNATRFCLMHFGDKVEEVSLDDLQIEDKWILSKVNTLAKEATENIDAYELGIGVQKIYDFVWDEFCDWYIEIVKPRLYNEEDKTRNAALYTLQTVLINALKMLHPFIPFITEEIFLSIQDKEETIMLSSYPVFRTEWKFEDEENSIELIKEITRSIRNTRTSMNVPPSKKANIFVVSEIENIRSIIEKSQTFFLNLAMASEVFVQSDKTNIDDDAVSSVFNGGVVYMPFAELVDVEKEKQRLEKEKEKFIKEIERVENKLSNQGFLAKAPDKLINQEKEKKEQYEEMLLKVEETLRNLK